MRRALASSVIALLLGGTASAESRAGYGGTAQGALASAPLAIDPLSGALGDLAVGALVFDTPFRLDAAGQPRPHLALALDATAPDRVRLRLRADVKFHDGSALKAADVAASLNRALRDAGGWTLAPIRAARAVGEDTVELELTRPAPDLPLLLSTPAAAVTPNGAAPGPRAIGSGPFAVDALAGLSVRLTAHHAHFAGRPYLDALTLKAFRTRVEETQSFDAGALAVSLHGASAFQAAPARRAVVVESGITLTGYLAMGRALPPPLAAALATALAVGIDRERLRNLVRDTTRPAGSAAPPALGGVEHRPPYDPTRAKAALAPLGARPRVTLTVDDLRFDDKPLADRLLAELGRLGIDLVIDAVDPLTYRKRLRTGEFELLLGTSVPPAPSAGLAELALVAVLDPSAARAALARAPAAPGLATPGPGLVPLYHRATRVHHAAELRGVAVDYAGRIGWPDLAWRR
jgi:peptide/nickel transport system substrate-binding protein